MQFVLASNNRKKLREMADILETLGHTVITMAEAGISAEPEETGETFEENALIKARAAAVLCHAPCLADDSGLEVDALGGAPGVHSARYCEGSDLDRLQMLLRNMENVPEGQRTARFVSAVACVFSEGGELVVRGECEGVMLREMRGDGGFGYDPAFYIPEEGQTFSEMSAARKCEISHRARAMAKFCDEMKKRG